MTQPSLARTTALLIGVVGAAGVISAGLQTSAPDQIEVARAVIIDAAVTTATPGDAVLADVEPEVAAPTVVPPTPTTLPPIPPASPPPTPPVPTPVTAPPAPAPAPPASAPTTAPDPTPQSSASLSACEQQMLDQMNDERVSRGTAPLRADDAITPIARSWSEEMARRQDLQHNPDYGPQVFAARPEAVRAGENVGRAFGTNAELHRAFMDSPSYRDAILAPGHTHAGLGCTTDARGQLWVTVNFWG